MHNPTQCPKIVLKPSIVPDNYTKAHLALEKYVKIY